MLLNILRVTVKRMGPDTAMVPSDRTRVNGHKLKHKKFHLNTRKNFESDGALGTGCLKRLWSLLLWRYSEPAWMRSCATCSRWSCFGKGVGLDDPQRSLPTPTILWFCNSVICILFIIHMYYAQTFCSRFVLCKQLWTHNWRSVCHYTVHLSHSPFHLRYLIIFTARTSVDFCLEICQVAPATGNWGQNWKDYLFQHSF